MMQENNPTFHTSNVLHNKHIISNSYCYNPHEIRMIVLFESLYERIDKNGAYYKADTTLLGMSQKMQYSVHVKGFQKGEFILSSLLY